ncbi:M48 family metallopeptidase [Nocardia sp. NPDC051030]|uniref:M48 family metallopeptidase n=1 Tax=Nocardia sp. NPDC051030 TaxID=3155162 RepID=UPI00341F188C
MYPAPTHLANYPTPQAISPYAKPDRHPWEIPLLTIACLLMALVVIATLLVAYAEGPEPVTWGVLGTPLALYFARGMQAAKLRVDSVKMSPTQFPEGYRMVQEAAARFGMKRVPDAYVLIGQGQINAHATGHGFRRFVVVNSDLFELGDSTRDPDALAFVIGHEVGHIAAGHTSFWRQVGETLVRLVPMAGNSVIRAQEYTADNYGYAYNHRGAAGMVATLAAGKYLNRVVDVNEFTEAAYTERGLFTVFANFISSHPVLTWRSAALRDRSRRGNLFFPPRRPKLPGH